MNSQDAKTYLASLCLAALLTGGGLAAPGQAFGMGQSGCSTNGTAQETNGNGDNDDDDDDEIVDPDGNGA